MEKNYAAKKKSGNKLKRTIVILLLAVICLVNNKAHAQVTANDDGPISIAENASMSGNVLGNDIGSSLIVPNAIASEGVITMNSNGVYTYDATGVAPGTTVTIDYVAVNPAGEFDIAVLTFDVVAGILANNDTYSISHTQTDPIYLGNVLDNDSFAASTTVTNPVNLLDDGNGNLITITSNGDVTVQASGLNNAVNGRVDYNYNISDGTNTDTARLRVRFTNIRPVANIDGPYYVVEGKTLNVAASDGVLINDTDTDLDALTAVLASGSVSLASNGSLLMMLLVM
ncbi:hypothetical protein MKD41_11110 [Lutibacter sp. A64]|uniref:hypothetical protein n=1 Tax=Lutibacter sp. A64 TaxID=2918526 RepID=UPI001F06F16C|nr:hypothetical protein [Lutibacter sp. A64]UMB52883.1 hypothetical protein MKD41_11110 [Lutibacter sp. A64]